MRENTLTCLKTLTVTKKYSPFTYESHSHISIYLHKNKLDDIYHIQYKNKNILFKLFQCSFNFKR